MNVVADGRYGISLLIISKWYFLLVHALNGSTVLPQSRHLSLGFTKIKSENCV